MSLLSQTKKSVRYCYCKTGVGDLSNKFHQKNLKLNYSSVILEILENPSEEIPGRKYVCAINCPLHSAVPDRTESSCGAA